MKNVFSVIERFFFQPISASGFGLMRIAWAGSVLFSFLTKWQDITRYWGTASLFPPEVVPYILRSDYIFSIFFFVTDPHAVMTIYIIFLVCLVFMMVGFLPRVMTTLSVLLLFSFHEANPLMLGGGDTVFRTIGFLLLISPCVSAISLKRLRQQWKHWNEHRAFLAPLTMPVWPMRLLLWQFVILYGTSVWFKTMGNMWLQGTAFAVPMFHPEFARMPGMMGTVLTSISPFMSWTTLVYESAWILLLVPKNIFRKAFFFHKAILKRALLVGGTIFHGTILLLMYVGSFSYAMLTGYLGLLTQDDFEAVRKSLNKRWLKRMQRRSKHEIDREKIAVFYDTFCRLCRRATFTIMILDTLHRLEAVNFNDEKLRKKLAPDLSFAALDLSMHIRFPDGRTVKGFDAFRALSWHLPPLWIIAPLLYIPGVAPIGRRIYKRISSNRKKCTHERC